MTQQTFSILSLTLPIPGGFFAAEALRHYASIHVNDHPKAKRDLAISAAFLAAAIGSACTTQSKIAYIGGVIAMSDLSATITLATNFVLGRFATGIYFPHAIHPPRSKNGG